MIKINLKTPAMMQSQHLQPLADNGRLGGVGAGFSLPIYAGLSPRLPTQSLLTKEGAHIESSPISSIGAMLTFATVGPEYLEWLTSPTTIIPALGYLAFMVGAGLFVRHRLGKEIGEIKSYVKSLFNRQIVPETPKEAVPELSYKDLLCEFSDSVLNTIIEPLKISKFQAPINPMLADNSIPENVGHSRPSEQASATVQILDFGTSEENLVFNGNERKELRSWLKINLHDFVDNSDRANAIIEVVRRGGFLIPTHSTRLSNAISIFETGEISPGRGGTVDSRAGIGFSYGEIVFVIDPLVVEGMGVRNIFLMNNPNEHYDRTMFDLAGKVEYNQNIRGDPNLNNCVHPDDSKKLMECGHQYETNHKVLLNQIIAVLVPEHLYDELINKIDNKYHSLLIKIPGTGQTEDIFTADKDKVVTRTPLQGGRYFSLVGKKAVFRYELAYFKLVNIYLERRYRILRERIEDFAQQINQNCDDIDLAKVDAFLTGIAPYLPEVMMAMRHPHPTSGAQYPSHDGRSPLGHTFNALQEAALVAKHLIGKFPVHTADLLIALLLHDIGKIDFPRDEKHIALSTKMAKYHLYMMGLDRNSSDVERDRRNRILHIIANGDLISNYSKATQSGAASDKLADKILKEAGSNLFDVFWLNYSDLASIPGLSGREMRRVVNYPSRDLRPNLIQAFNQLIERAKNNN